MAHDNGLDDETNAGGTPDDYEPAFGRCGPPGDDDMGIRQFQVDFGTTVFVSLNGRAKALAR